MPRAHPLQRRRRFQPEFGCNVRCALHRGPLRPAGNLPRLGNRIVQRSCGASGQARREMRDGPMIDIPVHGKVWGNNHRSSAPPLVRLPLDWNDADREAFSFRREPDHLVPILRLG